MKTTPDSIKEENEKLLEQVEAQDRDVEVVYDKDRDLKVPLKVGLRKEVRLSDLPVTWLFTLGNLSVKEYNEYLKANEGKLTINELTASDLLAGVLKKDQKSVELYWRLNEKMLSSKGVTMNNNIKIDIKPNNIMTQLLSSIEGEIFGDNKSVDNDDTTDYNEDIN